MSYFYTYFDFHLFFRQSTGSEELTITKGNLFTANKLLHFLKCY
jgi:hypothetical protein